MNLSLSLINRLRLGRSIGAEAPCELPGCRAWVLVQPVIGEREVVDTEACIERRIASPTDNPINTFEVRYTMFKESYLEYRYDLDFAWLDELTTDERYEAHSLAELEQLLARWIPDFAVLRIPADVRYPELPPKPGPGWWIWAHATQKSEGES